MTILALLSLGGQFLVIVTFFYLSIIAHELGHMFAALAIGWKPLVMTIGAGNKKTSFRIGGVSFIFGPIPAGGLMASAARRIDYWRAKRFLYTTGGPIATVCVLLVTLCICISYTLPAWWQTPVGVFFALEAAMLIGCLWPRNAKILGTIMPNDGLSMWRTLTLKKSDIPAHFAANVQHLACTLIKEGKLAEAKEVVMSGISPLFSPFDTRHCWIHCLLATDQIEPAKTECEDLLKDSRGFDKPYAEVLDALACLPVYHTYPKMLDDAMRYINLAISEAPDMITLKGTKASLLIEQGSLDEGMELLEEVSQKSAAKSDQAICKYYTAFAWYKKGEVNKAYEHLRLAQAIDPHCLVHQKIENLIAGKITSSRITL